jgi:hypothetical protein
VEAGWTQGLPRFDQTCTQVLSWQLNGVRIFSLQRCLADLIRCYFQILPQHIEMSDELILFILHFSGLQGVLRLRSWIQIEFWLCLLDRVPLLILVSEKRWLLTGRPTRWLHFVIVRVMLLSLYFQQSFWAFEGQLLLLLQIRVVAACIYRLT